MPNLAVTAISNPPSSVPQGQSWAPPTTYTVTNTGTVPAGTSLVKFYLVATVGTTKFDLKTADPEAVGALGPGATFTHGVTLTVKPETLPGTYFLQGCADSGKTVTEISENDNCRTSAGTVQVTPLPDLIVQKVTLIGAPPSIPQGGDLTIAVAVRNNGLLDAPASTLTFRDGRHPLSKTKGSPPCPPCLGVKRRSGRPRSRTTPFPARTSFRAASIPEKRGRRSPMAITARPRPGRSRSRACRCLPPIWR